MNIRSAFHFRTISLAALIGACAFTAGQIQAQTIFSDNFESYADQAALNGIWTNGSVTPSAGFPSGNGVTLTNRNFAGGTNVGYTVYAHESGYATLPESVGASEPCVVTFYLNRNSISTGAGQTRFYVRLSPSTVPSSAAGAGWFNNATMPVNGVADVFRGTNFQGFITGVGGNNLFNLNDPGCPLRTVGWHKFDVERRADGSTRYYVDNVLGRTITNASPVFQYFHAGFRTASTVPALPGEEVDIDNISVIKNNPTVDTPPHNVTTALGTSTNLSVVASGTPTGYRWYFGAYFGGNPNVIFSTNYFPISGDNISGEFSDTLTINPVRSTNEGYYFVVVSNANGHIGSAAARLLVGPPSVLSQTTNTSALEGGNFTVRVTAGGATPLSYQWFKNSGLIAGATASAYTKTGAAATDAGSYTARVTNSFGAVTSGVVSVTIVTNPYPNAMSPAWTKLPGDFPWLGGGNLARGLAYHSLSNQLLIASRNMGELIHVLDASTGAELYTLTTSAVIGGGTFTNNMLGVADDGAVYVGNLTLDGNTTNFKLYRFADTDPSTGATLAFDGNPGNGVSDRWGDTLAVRGAGVGTQVLLTSRNGTNAAILTTLDGFNFSATTLPCDVQPNAIGVGAAFGQGNTFWGISNDNATNALFQFSFDLGTASTTRLQTYTNVSPAGVNLGLNTAGNLLGVIGFETPNTLRLYDISSYPTQPLLLDWAFFTPNVAGFAVGNVAFGHGNRVYALSANNGILALQINWPVINAQKGGPDELIMNWVGKYKLQSATNVAGPYSEISGPVTSGPYTNSTGPIQFFRLAFP
jgi:hypothetical protein